MSSNNSVEELATWLNSLTLSVKPSLKVNGREFPSAVIAVDFGSPLDPVKLNSDQNSELISKMRSAVSSLTGNRSVRVSHDSSNGVYWASAF